MLESNLFSMQRERVEAADIQQRVERLSWWPWAPGQLETIRELFSHLPTSLPVDNIEERLETVPDLVDGITVARWGLVCEEVLPEAYAEPKASKKTSDSIPGSRSRLWRMAERARTGLSLHHPRDTHGVANPVQLTLF